MPIFHDPRKMRFPFTFFGICPYQDCASALPTWTAENIEDLNDVYCPNCGRKIRLSEDGKSLFPDECRSYATHDGSTASVSTEGTTIVWTERITPRNEVETYRFDSALARSIIAAFESRGGSSTLESLSAVLPGLVRDHEQLIAEDCRALVTLVLSAVQETEHPAAARRQQSGAG